jgi:hypothetical protein
VRKSVAEIIPCFYRIENCFQVLVNGDKPASIPTGKMLSLRDWRSFLRKSKSVERKNPILEGRRYLEFLEQNPGLTYKNVADEFDITKARVSQMIAIVKKLPQEITNYFMSNNDSLDLTFFTERKLRPLTLMKSDKVKIEMFREIRESIPAPKVLFSLTYFGDSQNTLLSSYKHTSSNQWLHCILV